MSKKKSAVKRRSRLTIESLEPRRLLDVSGVWQELGFRSASGSGLSHGGVDAFTGDPAIAQTPEGQTVVAYEGTLGIQVQMYDGFSWVSLNDPITQSIPGSTGGRYPDVAVDHLGGVYVTWRGGSNAGSDVFMSKGSLDPVSGLWSWSGLGGSTSGGGVSDDGVTNGAPAIAVGLGSSLTPVIAYSAHDTIQKDMDVVAKKYVASLDQWVELAGGADFLSGGGGVSNDALASGGTPDSPQAVDIAIGGDNAPIVVWSSFVGADRGDQIYARRWNEITSTWEKIGGQSAGDPAESPPGGISGNVPGISIDPRIAIRQDPEHPDQDIVMVGWRNLESRYQPNISAIYVKQLDDPTPVTGSWVQISAGSASGEGIVGRDEQRDLSLDIGADGLPLIGLTRYQVAPAELAIDTTPPWSSSNLMSDVGAQVESNWYAWGLEAYSEGGEVLWRWMGSDEDGEGANYGVNAARYTDIVGLSDGSALLVFGEDLSSIEGAASWEGGPWDPGHYPTDAVDPEIYAHRYDSTTGEWGNYGAGSGEAGGLDNDIRWNSDPVLATAGDGSVLAAYAERIGDEMFVRVRAFDDGLGRWVALGQGLEQGISFNEAEVLGRTFRWDEVAIGSAPGLGGDPTGRPVIAYLDHINTADQNVADHSTITVWAYDEGQDTWDRLDTGSTGADQYAYVTEGTVWEGYLSDQIEIIAEADNKAYLAWRNVDPRDGSDVNDGLVHVNDVAEGGTKPFDQEQGSSEIYFLEWAWRGTEWEWNGLADGSDQFGRPNPFGALTELNHLNFDPSLLLGSGGSIWAAFTAGRFDTASGMLLGDIAVYEFDTGQNNWESRFGGPFVAASGHGYAHPELALGTDNGLPMIAWEDQEWTRRDLQDMGLLGGWNSFVSDNPSSRPNFSSDEKTPQWRLYPFTMHLEGDPPKPAPPYEEAASNDTYEDRELPQGNSPVPYDRIVQINGTLESGDIDFYEVRLPEYDENGLPYFGAFTDTRWDGDRVAAAEISVSLGDGMQTKLVSYWDGFEVPGSDEIWGWDYDTGIVVSNDLMETEDTLLPIKAEIDESKDELVIRFSIEDAEGSEGDYTVEIRPIVEALVVEDGFQQLVGASILTAQYHVVPTGGDVSRYWSQADPILPPSGRAYVLPELTSGPGLVPLLTYTSLELDQAGFPITEVSRWKLDLSSLSWTKQDVLPGNSGADTWHSIDLGLRSYFNGQWGGQGDGFPSERAYSDAVASYFEPRIMYGARHIDFEFAWWRTQAGWGSPKKWWVLTDGGGEEYRIPGPSGWEDWATWDDYRTPLPGDSEVSYSYGWRADGHVAGTSYIHALRYDGFGWEQINSQDPLGNTLESGEGVGLNAMVDGIAWAPGFGSSIGVRGVGEAMFDTQPVVAWNQIERNLINVRQWLPENDLPRMQVSETSGIANDGRVGFGRVITGADAYETLVLKNVGDDTLTVSGLVIVGDGYQATDQNGVPLVDVDGDGYLDLILPDGKIEPGGDARIQVHYDPSEPGLDSGTLYIFSNDPLASPLNHNWYTVNLAGSAYTGGDIEVTETEGIHNDLAVPFGLVAVGGQNDRTVTIKNNGMGDLTVQLALQGVGHGFVLPSGYDSPVVIAPGESEEVTITFNGISANQDGALAYLVIEHDDYGGAFGVDPILDRQPYTVALVGNMPSLMDPTVVGAGSLPSVAFESLAYNVNTSGLNLYDIPQGGLPSSIEFSDADRPRSDGNFTVYAKGGAVWLYDRSTGASINLTGDAYLGGLSDAANPNIEGRYVVFSAYTGTGLGIIAVELNVDAGGSVQTANPIAQAVLIPDIGQGGYNDHPDITGNDVDGLWVVWQRMDFDPVGEEFAYTVYGAHAAGLADLGTAQAIEMSVGQLTDGVRIPRVSGEYAVWVERSSGENRVVLYQRGQGPGTLLSQQAQISDEVAISGDLLVWADNRNGNFDLFGYFLPADAGQGSEFVDVRERQFQLTFASTDEITPDVSGSWVAWDGWTVDSYGIPMQAVQYAGLSANANAHVELVSDGTDVTDGGTLDFGNLNVDVDGTYHQSILLEISNTGTGILSITDVIADLSGNAQAQIILPGDLVIHQGPWTRQVEIILTATGLSVIDGTITIQTNDPANGEIVLNVDGQAQAPTIALTEDAAGTTPITSLDFGDVEQTDSTVSFYVRNEASNGVPLVLLNPTMSDLELSAELVAGASTGSYNSMGHYVVDPGEYALFNITWSPEALGTLDATFELTSNDLANSPVTLNLTGESVGYPTIVLLDDDIPPNPITTSVEFGEVIKGDYAEMVVTIRNDGIVDLVISSIALDEAGVFDFVPPLGAMPIMIAPDNSMQLTVRFTPDSPGAHAGVMTIESNDPDTPIATVSLNGQGYVIPEITVSYDGLSLVSDLGRIDAGDVVACSQWTGMLTIRNDDEGELVIDSWSLAPASGTPDGVFGIVSIANYASPDGRVHIASGQEILVAVTFTPPADAEWPANDGRIEFGATLTIENNDDDRNDDGDTEDPFSIGLVGEGVAPLVSVSDTSHAFGNVQLGETGTWTPRITNQGQADLVLSNWTGSGGIFSVTSPDVTGDVVIAAGATLDVTVRFEPGGIGGQQGTISFSNNDPTSSTGAVSLTMSGQGVAGKVQITETSGLESNDNLLEFQGVTIHTTSTVTVTLTNGGDGALSLTSWTSDSGLFSLDPNSPPMMLSPGESTTLDVIFSPVETGYFAGHITVNSDDPDSPAYVINLTGSGTAADIDVTEGSGLVGNDDALDFGDVPIGQVASQTFTVHNRGQAPLTIDRVEFVSGGTVTDFGPYKLDTAFVGGLTVQPGQSTLIRVNFTPTYPGDENAELRLYSDDPDESPYTVELGGRGVVADLVVLETSGRQANDDVIEFGQVKVGTTASLVVTLRNDGHIPLDLTEWSMSAFSQFHLVPGSVPATAVEPGRSVQLTIQYTPTSEGAFSDTLTIAGNDHDRPNYTLSVTGTGVTPTIRAEEGSGTANDDQIAFGDVNVGQTVLETVTIHNDGLAPLVLSKYESTNTYFTVQPANGSGTGDDVTMLPGTSLTVDIVFTPIWESFENGVITFVSDAGNENRYSIAVTGNGLYESVPGDFDDSGQTDMADFEMFRAAFGLSQGAPDFQENAAFDLTGDGTIDFADLAVFANHYGQSEFGDGKDGQTAKVATVATLRLDVDVQPIILTSNQGVAAKAAATEAAAGETPGASQGFGEQSGDGSGLYSSLAAALNTGLLSAGTGTVVDDDGSAMTTLSDSQDGLESAAVPTETRTGVLLDTGLFGTDASGALIQGTDASAVPFAMVAGTAPVEGSLNIDELGEMDSLVAPYASALLPR